jgi:hypothetical protein
MILSLAVGFTVIGGIVYAIINWSKIFPPKPMDATFILQNITTADATGKLRESLQNGIKIDVNGGDGEPPKSSCIPKSIQLIVVVASIDILCEVSNALLKQRSNDIKQNTKTVIVDATKGDHAIVHESIGDNVIIVKKNGETQYTTDYTKDDFECKKLLRAIGEIAKH